MAHHVGPIEGPSETPRTSQHYSTEGIKANTQLDPVTGVLPK